MSDLNFVEHELGWDDEIVREGSPFQIVPEGDYWFAVKKLERARHNGSEKIPPCNKAILTLCVNNDEGVLADIQTTLFLHSKFEWKLCQFFTAIGQRKRGEAFRMNWNAVPLSTGRCRIEIHTWTGTDGKERKNNEVTMFYEPEPDSVQPQNTPDTPPATGTYTPGKF